LRNSLIYFSQSIALQRIQDYVNFGYTHYVAGSAPVNKIESVFNKFDMNYQACLGRYQRFKRTKSGLGNVHLVMWLRGEKVHWLLLATPPEAGSHPIHETDNLKNALVAGQRIEVAGYELVRLPKKGTDHTKLTWRMTQTKFDGLSAGIRAAVRSKSHHGMNHALHQVWSHPGFNGIRSQIGKLVVEYRAEVRRASIKNAPTPPKRLYYLNRINHDGITVKQLLLQLRKQA
jgi:hypothetical protein